MAVMDKIMLIIFQAIQAYSDLTVIFAVSSAAKKKAISQALKSDSEIISLQMSRKIKLSRKA